MSCGVGLYKHLFRFDRDSQVMELLAMTLIAITQ